MSETAIIAMVAIAGIVGLVVGHIVGERHGRDSQWVDGFIEAGLRDRARRSKDGRFISTRRATP